MNRRSVDVAVIGAGSAGLPARRAARAAGASCVLIDSGPLGTTCARVGCMPSKLLIAAADAAHAVRSGEVFGLRTTLTVDGGAVLERVQRERDRFVGFVLRSLEAVRQEGDLIEGTARLIGPHTLRVDDHTELEARSIVVATGSAPVVPPPFRGLGDRLLSNETLFELSELPRSVLVAGAGVIGLELGQALQRLGTRVTLVSIDDAVGPLADPRCRAAALQAFGAEYELFLNYRLEQLERQGERVEVRFRDSAGTPHLRTVDRVLMAAGRQPRLAGLGLEHAGVQLERGQVRDWDPATTRIGQTHVFLAGDVSAYRPLLHEAADEGQIAGLNAARYPAVAAEPRRTPLAIVFSEPQLAIVGASFRTLDGERHRIGEVDYGDQGRARVMHQNRGLARLYGEVGTELLVGAEMVGPRVEHTAHLLAWAIQQRLTVPQLLQLPFYHPVIEEGIRTALRSLKTALASPRSPDTDCREFRPGS
ncbi:MAG: dihydrolipoyl dehydrogenase [Proteobacteria bacterium]|nr:dihydrolipoyl dehydrogenase [Pseudomonadota bacterium]